MKANDINYFNNGLLIQADKDKTFYIVQNSGLDASFKFSLDKFNMAKYLEMPQGATITLDKTLKIQTSDFKASLKLDSTELVTPELNDCKVINNVPIKALKIAAKFTSNSNNKPILNGVHISNYIEATDSFSAFRYPLEENQADFVINSKFINELPDDDIVTIQFDNKIASIEHEGVKYITTLYEGKYPILGKIYDSVLLNNSVICLEKPQICDILRFSNNIDNLIISQNKIEIKGDNHFEKEIKCEMQERTYLSVELFKKTFDSVKGDNLFLNFVSNIKPIIVNDYWLILPIKGE